MTILGVALPVKMSYTLPLVTLLTVQLTASLLFLAIFAAVIDVIVFPCGVVKLPVREMVGVLSPAILVGRSIIPRMLVLFVAIPRQNKKLLGRLYTTHLYWHLSNSVLYSGGTSFANVDTEPSSILIAAMVYDEAARQLKFPPGLIKHSTPPLCTLVMKYVLVPAV